MLIVEDFLMWNVNGRWLDLLLMQMVITWHLYVVSSIPHLSAQDSLCSMYSRRQRRWKDWQSEGYDRT